MKKIILAILFTSLFFSFTIAQTFNTIDFIYDSCDSHLSLKFESTSFFKNNEYSNEFTKGFTGLGFFIKPSLEYYINDKTKASAGFFALKYSGIDNFTQLIPIFTVQHKLNKTIDILFGSLYSTLNHKLEEPIYRFDEYYQNNVEYGLQFLYKNALIESDLWLSWEQFIFKNSPYQEEFVAGNNTRIKVYQSNSFNLSFPLQILISHIGGEIDSSPNAMASIINGVTGLNLDYNLDQSHSIGFTPLYFLYQGWNLPESGVNSELFNAGKALYLKLNYSGKYFNSMIGYWSTDKFIAPRGEYLFQSVSEWDPSFAQDRRELITAKFSVNRKMLDSFILEFRADTYYDISTKDIAYSYGLYIVLKESFFIKKIKPLK